jgi:FtsZ-interacting cell division protein ZipA
MSDLQLALLVLGAIIIIAVVAFNWWQERRLRNEAAEHFEVPGSDVLMDEDFQFDPDAILPDESQDLRKLAADDFDALNFDEERRADDVQHDVFLNQQADEEYEEAVELPAQPVGSEFIEEREDVASEELVPEESVSAAVSDTEPPKLYEEHVWQSDALNMQASTTEPGTLEQAALIKEAGFDEPLSSLESPAEMAVSSAGSARDVVTLSPDIDSRVDLIAVLYLPQAVTGDKLREFLMTVTDIDKPKFMHGLDMDGVWRLITREQEATSFSKVTCAVQLADRSGFISRNALNRFQHEVDRIGHKFSAQIEWQSNGDPWQQASELDQFCIDVDKMVGFHLTQGENGPFTGTKFRGLAEANGLILGTDGGFHSENDMGLRLFSVVNRDNNPFSQAMLRTSVIHGLTFQLDIPRVRNCSEVFNQMVLTARQMENSLGATLVDDNQRPLGEMQIEKIRQQLKVIHAKMVARGIIPGSVSALRLFS